MRRRRVEIDRQEQMANKVSKGDAFYFWGASRDGGSL
jgi:hypothetical protein